MSAETSAKKLAARLALTYGVVGVLWILFSDRVLVWMVADEARVIQLQTWKGWFYILATAVLLYGAAYRYLRRLEDTSSEQQRTQEALQESESRYRATFEHAAVGITHMNPEGKWIWMNDRFLSTLGHGREVLLGASYQNFTHPDDLKADADLRRRILGGEVPSCQFEKRYRHRLGHDVWVRVTLSLVKKGDAPLYLIAVSEEIGSHKQAEAEIQALNGELELRVEERTAALAAKSRELESFCYSVSHDLKAPLRGIDGYSRLLLEDHGEKLGNEGRLFLENVRRATLQMNQLIEDLLAYSRLERRKTSRSALPTADFVARRLDGWDKELTATAVTVDVEPAWVEADHEGLSVAFRNLIDNALKFSSRVKQPAITITGRTSENCYILSIRDNGTGFDPKYTDRIFEIFQRLHLAEDYPGTGIGLALVRKAMERMNGRVWAESAPGAGSVFHLSLPMADPPTTPPTEYA